MTAAQIILLLSMIDKGANTAITVGMAYEKIMGMSPEQVDEANKSERQKTEMLMEITRSI